MTFWFLVWNSRVLAGDLNLERWIVRLTDMKYYAFSRTNL